jgi:outer membrane receptor protein involved in Fe transport
MVLRARPAADAARAFYKKLERPIEAVAFQQGGTFFTTFANAPEAQLYGGEIELQRYFPLEGLGGSFFAARRAVLIGNYTYTKSKIRWARATPPSRSAPLASRSASNVFDDGQPLTGQSDHIANLQIGLENTDRLSQQTLCSPMPASASPIAARGSSRTSSKSRACASISSLARHPPVGVEGELKFEARNLTGEDYEEYQALNGSRSIITATMSVAHSASASRSTSDLIPPVRGGTYPQGFSRYHFVKMYFVPARTFMPWWMVRD